MCFARKTENIDLPAPGRYATGIFFLDNVTHAKVEEKFGQLATEHGLEVICWRTVPRNCSVIGEVARTNEPLMRQLFIKPAAPDAEFDEERFKRQLFIVRKLSTHQIEGENLRFYICSLSTDIIVYKVGSESFGPKILRIDASSSSRPAGTIHAVPAVELLR